ncbi:MAG: hypothetical protein LUH22_19590 [Bacteroides sp.]|nr:hypothetical protein [Bacteroides sp.]
MENGGDDISPPTHTRADMTIEVVANGVLKDDSVRTARFIVFDNASTSPSLDINQKITLDKNKQDAKKFKSIFKVSSNPDKMVVVILNEPQAVSGLLNNMTSPLGLEDLTFEMAQAFTANHTEPLSTGLPMTGAVRGVTITPENDPAKNVISMTVERAVARVEVWLKKADDLREAEVNTSTVMTLSRTHNLGYLVAGTKNDKTRYQTGADEINNLGHMLTVDNPSEIVTWNYTGSSPQQINDDGTATLVCAFYTPERTCSDASGDDKLKLTLEGIQTTGKVKSGETLLDQFTSESGITQDLDTIKRNNVYRIIGNLKNDVMDFGCRVVQWKEAQEVIIIDPQYFLNVSTDQVFLGNETKFITAVTNYNIDNRGFPKGLQLSDEIKYYAPDNTEMDSNDGDRYGWMAIDRNGNNGDENLIIFFRPIKIITPNNTGCYAVVELKAGNLTKRIKITRYPL